MQGRAYLVYNPTNTPFSGSELNTLPNAISVPVPVNGEIQTFELTVPFFSETFTDFVGNVELYVYNTLRGASTLDCTLYFKPVNVELAIRQPYVAPVAVVSSAVTEQSNEVTITAINDVVIHIKVPEQGELLAAREKIKELETELDLVKR
jgi:predicted component of type VI protein secretion system